MSEMISGRLTEIIRDRTAGPAPSPSSSIALPGKPQSSWQSPHRAKVVRLSLLRRARDDTVVYSVRMARRVRMSRLLARSHHLWGALRLSARPSNNCGTHGRVQLWSMSVPLATHSLSYPATTPVTFADGYGHSATPATVRRWAQTFARFGNRAPDPGHHSQIGLHV
jgi:hypothetical protein